MLLKFFKPDEFACKCGCGKGLENMDLELIDRLEKARAIAGVAFVITSAIRCPRHNRAVGGVDNSAHVGGYAVDIAIPNDRKRAVINQALRQAGFLRLGYAKGFTHVDCDPTKQSPREWVY